jgi:non-homologous end joining protein Ku
MSPRPYWQGYLKLSLVSCPIAVHAASSTAERISFRQINRKTGKPAPRRAPPARKRA